jgi:hypothetical protein
MTIKRDAVKAGAEGILLASLLANAAEAGVEYAYFVSRMPHFKQWVEREVKAGKREPFGPKSEDLQTAAEYYFELRDEDGKRYDPQLKMYESFGYKLERVVAEAFDDDASYNYGVVGKADIPPSNVFKKVKLARKAVALALRCMAKYPKVATKLF